MGVPGRKPNPRKRGGAGGPASRPLRITKKIKQVWAPPAWFDDHHIEFWEGTVWRLAAEGVIADKDRPSLEILADCWAQFRDAQERIKTEGATVTTPNGFQQSNPAVSERNKAREQFRLLGAEFGLTPSARLRLEGENGQGRDGDEDWRGTGIDR